jgi:protein gp37
VSPACDFCYAERLNKRFGGRPYDGGGTPLLDKLALNEPLRWTRPRRVFVCSMTDLFWEKVPTTWIERVWAVMHLARRHTFQVLTKRPERMAALLGPDWFRDTVRNAADHQRALFGPGTLPDQPEAWPLPNVWVGVTAENQGQVMRRVPHLEAAPAVVRFVSVEPMLGSVDLWPWLRLIPPAVDWVITGGESGGPPDRRMVMPWRETEWDGPGGSRTAWRPTDRAVRHVRSVRDQCLDAAVPFFFKQWGGPTPKAGGALLDGREWRQFPRVIDGVVRGVEEGTP